jgi:hypothetical protein
MPFKLLQFRVREAEEGRPPGSQSGRPGSTPGRTTQFLPSWPNRQRHDVEGVDGAGSNPAEGTQARVAQLAEASDPGSEGWGFESLSGHEVMAVQEGWPSGKAAAC